MAYGRSVVAQNNYGGAFYQVGAFEPGLARVDVRADYSGCDIVWEDKTISSQVPPRLSTGDGHVWLYSHKRGEADNVHAYYLTAIDFETGKVASEIFVASGKRMDNPMLSVDFLPGGVMIGGIRNGIISVCDSAPDPSGKPVCTVAKAGSSSGDTQAEDSGGCAVSATRKGTDLPAMALLSLFLFCALYSRRVRQ
jgi:hypothetical protein